MNEKTPGGLREATATFEGALALHQRGNAAEADALCAAIVRDQPGHFNALHLRGLLAFERGDDEAGFDFIKRSLVINSNQPAAYSNSGNRLLKLGRAEDALSMFEHALRLKPDYVVALYNRGNALCELKLPEEALASYRRALQLQPNYLPVLNRCARVLLELNRADEALACADEMIRIDPAGFDGHFNRGDALFRLQLFGEALAAYDKALLLRPDSAAARVNRGNTLDASGRPAEAVMDYERALRLDPQSAAAMTNLGLALLKLKRTADALPWFERAIGSADARPAALVGRAQSLEALHRYAESADCLQELLREHPEYPYAAGHVAQICLNGHVWQGLAERIEALMSDVDRGKRVVKPFTMLALSPSAAAQFHCARIYSADLWPNRTRPASIRNHYRHGKIRIAYVSGDLREHAVSYLMAGVLEQHDRDRFEITAVSFRERENTPFGARVAAAFDRFVCVGNRTDREVAALMQELEVDIAVDLMGLAGESRLGVFSHGAAPVQATYLGYAGTTGAPYMDYLIADGVVIPPGEERWYTEQIVRLPHCYLPNDDRREIANRPSRSQAGLPEEGFVFCAFTNAYKINQPMFDIWMQLLRESPGSVLWLRATDPEGVDNLQREAARTGVDAGRLVFAPLLTGVADHLARHSLADLYLDTLPYNAHSTTCDALWSGVPVLTCRGRSFAGRVAASALTSIGLAELIAETADEYKRKALELVWHPDRLRDLRRRLAQNRAASPLFDTRRFTRQLEAAYLHMVERAERGDVPRAFNVAPC